jgi:hypothetical protein
VRATGFGGVWFVTGTNAAGFPTWGCYAQNGTGWTSDDKAIGLQDADGVALAAIQGLYQLAQRQARDLDMLRSELAAQRAELESRHAPPNGGVQPRARAELAH